MTTRADDPHTCQFAEQIPGGAHWSFVVRRGRALRLTDINGGANVAMLLYNATNPLERYNMADTLKAQHTARLTRGHVCYSDMGRILMSVIEDDRGWHDTICGLSDADMVRDKYGEAPYQSHRNDFYRNSRDSLLIELGKWGLGPRDLVANINLFSRVVVADDGTLTFMPQQQGAGDRVVLRAEMDTLVVLTTCQHPLDPVAAYAPQPILAEVLPQPPVAEDDYCRNFCDENRRGFQNTEVLYR